MNNKELATSRKITSELIGGWFLWGILFGIIYMFIYNFIIYSINSLLIKVIITIILQAIITFLTWKNSASSTFKKRTMDYNDIPTVMRNLTIFTIIICLINGIYQYTQVNSTIDQAINSNYQLKFAESRMSYLYDDEEMEAYQQKKEQEIANLKKQCYEYLALIEIGLTAVYLGVLPFVKKQILKYVE